MVLVYFFNSLFFKKVPKNHSSFMVFQANPVEESETPNGPVAVPMKFPSAGMKFTSNNI